MTAVPPMPPQVQSPGSIYNPGYAGRPLFEDQRPRNIGDILTIVIRKTSTRRNRRAPTRTAQAPAKLSAVPITPGFLGGLFGKTNLSANGANVFNGTGGANASNTFNGTITVTVTGVLPNGNLHGERRKADADQPG